MKRNLFLFISNFLLVVKNISKGVRSPSLFLLHLKTKVVVFVCVLVVVAVFFAVVVFAVVSVFVVVVVYDPDCAVAVVILFLLLFC